MRLLKRNRQKVYYRNYESETDATTTDEYGNVLETSEKNKVYGEVKMVKAYVKSAIGTSPAEPFGDFTDKKRTIYVDHDLEDINEYSQIWIGIDPAVDENGEPTIPSNFKVGGVARGLNHVRISVDAVEVKLA